MLGRAIRRRAAMAAVVVCAAAAAAASGQSVFTNATGIAGQFSGPAAPYPSELVVSGLTEPVALVRVRISGLSHELSSQELDVLLVAPTGETVLLMSDVGALAPVNGIDLVFDDQYPALTTAAIASGTYSPTNLNDGIGTDDFDAPAPAGPYGATLGTFRGKAGNGTWKLFVMDDTGGDVGAIASWALEIFQGTCVVTTADNGPGSLRDTIDTANSNPDLSTICFAIPVSDPGYNPMTGVWTIAPTSELPAITRPVILDGLTQQGASCGVWPPSLKVVLSGAAAGPGATGLRLNQNADGSTIRGMVVNQWTQRGIDLNGPDGCKVQGCFVGTDHTGLVDLGNGGNGVVVRNSGVGNIVGVDGDGSGDACERNLISGNDADGVAVIENSTDQTRVAGNYIGVDVTGGVPLGNSSRGICVQDGATNTVLGTNADGNGDTLERNIISGNGGAGIHLVGAAASTTVLGNLIGLDKDGQSVIGNGSHGVHAQNSPGVTIGSVDPDATTAQTRNTISGNGGRGVYAEDCPDIAIFNNSCGTDLSGLIDLGNMTCGVRLDRCTNARVGLDTDAACGNVLSGNMLRGLRLVESDGVRVFNNRIGLGSDGSSPVGNDAEGVLIENCRSFVLVSNVISANGRDGVRIEGGTQSMSLLSGNLIGTDVTGALDRGNGQDGVMILQGAENITISNSVMPNVIAFNTGNGVSINGGATRRIFVYGNSIHSNGLLGINLDGAGVTPNDAANQLDNDNGPNDQLNFPTITSIVGTTINGEYQGLPNQSLFIDVYQNAEPDPSGNGEGQLYLGYTTCATNAAGFGTWSLTNVVYRTTPLYIAATATDTGFLIGTSEFGPVALTNLCKIACPTGPVELAAGPACTAVATYGVTTAGNCDPNVVLSFVPPEGTALPLGPTQVTATLRNAAGATLDECQFTAQVVDDSPPLLSCPNAIVQPNDLNECGAVVQFIVGVQDACDPVPTVTYSIPDGMGGQILIPSSYFFPVGTTTVTANATDAAGNVAIPCSFNVTVNDTQGPILNCQDIEVEADQFGNVLITESLVFPNGVADNCPGCAVQSIAFSPPIIDCALLQDYVIAVTATDCRQNTSTCVFTLTVTGPDCNENGVSDGCDIRSGTSADCNENLIPDECECLWCNGEESSEPALATGQASHLGGGSPMGNKVVDDIYFPPGQVQRLTAFEGSMLTDSIPELRRATLEFYSDCNGEPAGEPFLTVGTEDSEVVSAVPASDGLFLVKYRFDLCDKCLWLDGGKTYWVGLTGVTDNVNMSDLSYWVVDERPEARIMGRPGFKAEGTTTPGWGGTFTMGEWMPIEDCCVGCHNMVFCIFGDSCKVIWDNGAVGTAQADASASPPSGAHRAYSARAADDFVTQTCEPQEICLIDAWVWTDCEPPHGFIEIYQNEPCDSPSPELEPLRRFEADKAIDTGISATIGGRHYKLYILRVIDPGWTAPPGQTFWLSAGVESTGSFIVGSRFGRVNDTCRACEYTIAPAHGRSIRPTVTEWLPVQPLGAMAFRIAARPGADNLPAAIPPSAPACMADANYDGQVAVDDIFTFLSAWFVGCP